MPCWQLQSKLRLRRSIWRRMAISCSLCLCRHTSRQPRPRHPIITICLQWLSRITAEPLCTHYFHVSSGERRGGTPSPDEPSPLRQQGPGPASPSPEFPQRDNAKGRDGVWQTLKWRRSCDSSTSRHTTALSRRSLIVVRPHEKQSWVQVFPTKVALFTGVSPMVLFIFFNLIGTP